MIWMNNCWVGVKQQSLTQTFKQIHTIEYRNMASFLRFKVNLLRRENHLVVSNELNTRFELWVPGVWTITWSLLLNMLSLAVLSSLLHFTCDNHYNTLICPSFSIWSTPLWGIRYIQNVFHLISSLALCSICITIVCLFVVFRLVIVFPLFLRVTTLITPVVYENFSHRRQVNHATMYVKIQKQSSRYNQIWHM